MSIQPSTYSPDIAVPQDKRVFGARDLFSLWFSLGIGLMVLQTGALLAPGLGLSGSLLAILLGTLVGVLLLAAVGVIGSDTGLSAMAALKLSLGSRGASLPALLNLLQLIGWGSFEIIVMRDAASLLGTRAFSEGSLLASPLLWTVLFGGLATVLAVSGPLTFVRQILRKWGIWLLLAACLWLTWNLFAKADLVALWAQAGDGSMPFAVGFDIAIAMPLSWLPLIADYSRFGKRAKSVFGGTALGFFIGNFWLMSLGVAYTLAFAPSAEVNALLLALAGAGLGIPLLLILLDESENAFADIHSAAVSSGMLLRLKVEHLALAIGVICTVIACLAPLAQLPELPVADRLSVCATVRRGTGGSLHPAPSAPGRGDPTALAGAAGVAGRHRHLPPAGAPVPGYWRNPAGIAAGRVAAVHPGAGGQWRAGISSGLITPVRRA